ncbi:MAG: ABC transporter substrate-binding protein [Alphaproteobacteria bacterium]|nr:ABC transporter substrate-binding protein [Alphaproteobacteria bacterium]
MRKAGILLGAIAALAMMTVTVAQAGPASIKGHGRPTMTDIAGPRWQTPRSWLKPVANESSKFTLTLDQSAPKDDVVAASAREADRTWAEATIDDGEHLVLLLNSPASDEELASRLAEIAPAAGPETVNPDHAISALKKLSHQAVSILNNGKLDQSSRIAQFHGLMSRDFDIPLMARFALGRHWKRADTDQRTAYVDAFSKFLLHNYAPKIAGAKVARFDVLSARRAGKRDVMVQSRIARGNGQILKLVWRMRQRNGQFRVIDVVAEGVSLALTKRQEFAAILKANGGDVAPLITRLRQISA